mmetsp:Transcript_33965/g.87209  ORF Transcript_33965/g.87209 Transcript_33965/m.87209 type:complete len:232 (-) Transcript_33965:335-1030(-)
MQNASVKEQFKKMWPDRIVAGTSWCSTLPSSRTLSCRLYLSRISSTTTRRGPSPPITKSTCGSLAHTIGMILASKSTPFRSTSLPMATTTILSCWAGRGEGRKAVASTALGMTLTLAAGRRPRSTVFSLPTLDTQKIASAFDTSISIMRFIISAEPSSKPNSEWSVKAVRMPNTWLNSRHSYPSVEKAWCACTMSTPSRRTMSRKRGKKEVMVGSVTRPLLNTSGMGGRGR